MDDRDACHLARGSVSSVRRMRISKASLETWFKIAKRATWSNFSEARAIFPHADAVGTCVVFNIGGNKYRLIARLRYASTRISRAGSMSFTS